MAEKTLAQKLLIKPGYRVLLDDVPEGYFEALGPLPPGVSLTAAREEPTDLVLAFVRSRRELEEALARLQGAFGPKTVLWVAYPKGASGIKTDIHRDIIRDYAATVGLTAVSLIAVDDTWSAMRLKVQ